MLQLQKFLYENENWRELLTKSPYNLKLDEKEELCCFKYTMNSDFSLEITNEARGIILNTSTLEVVCYPFKKFYNYGEPFAAQIDWSSAKVQEKMDGSIIKVYFYNGQWRIATNTKVDAADASLNCGGYKTFKDLFMQAAANVGLDFDKLNKENTYIFELCSPFNRVVLNYEDTFIIHIGTRNNITYEELNEDIGVRKPKEYNLTSLEDCVDFLKQYDTNNLIEGFVVVDKDYNRIKIKTETYLSLHYLSNNNTLTLKRAIALIRGNELDEFLPYFPHFEEYIDKVKKAIYRFCLDFTMTRMEALVERLYHNNKAEFASVAARKPLSWVWFKVYSNPDYSFKDWFDNAPISQVVDYVEKYME